MGEPAKAFWITEEEESQPGPEMNFEDIAFLSTGVEDDYWKFGSD